MSIGVMKVEKTGGEKVKLISDGIVCSIAQAISRQADAEELIDAVVREFAHGDIYDSWKQYFTVFNGVICKGRKKAISDIARTEIRLCVGDIVKHLKKNSQALET